MRPLLLDRGVQVDPEDAHLLAAGGRITAQGYVGINRADLLHRVITNATPGTHVDHINGDKLDNRRENLRVVTPQINQVNRKRRNRNNTSGHRGVCYAPAASPTKHWRAQITVNGRNIHLGMFATKEEAVVARRAAELEHYGELCP